jgi:hypothetical protein
LEPHIALLLRRHYGRSSEKVEPLQRLLYDGAPADEAAIVEPIVVETAKPTEYSVRSATQAIASQLELQIRANPHLWYQFYSYWGPDGVEQHE